MAEQQEKTKWFGHGGFFSKLWSDTKDNVSSTFEYTAKNNFMDSLTESARKVVSTSYGLDNSGISAYDSYTDGNYKNAANRGFTATYTKNTNPINAGSFIKYTDKMNPGLKAANAFTSVGNNEIFYDGDKEVDNLRSKMFIPDYGYDIFLNERSIFQKGLHNFFGGPGYFYFKIFFKFDTQYGLFGGLFENPDGIVTSNSAAGFFTSLSTHSLLSNRLLIVERYKALEKFARTLSYINCTAPWFFKSIRGLDKANSLQLENYSKERSISIGCSEEAIDMRLNTLMDLYKFICYDDVNNREILPENLRKFDMAVMVFQSPIQILHTPLKANGSGNKNVLLGMPNTDYSGDNFMGFKIFNFIGCEFNLNSAGSMIPGDMNNEAPFQMGKGTIDITYNKCVRLDSNEFEGILFGDYGLFYDYDHTSNGSRVKLYGSMKGTIKGANGSPFRLAALHSNSLTGKSQGSGNKIIDINEAYVRNNLTKLSRYTMGNIFGEKAALEYYNKYESGITGNHSWTPMKMWKVDRVKGDKSTLETLAEQGLNFIAKLLRMTPSGWNTWLSEGHRDAAIGGPVFQWEMRKLCSAFPHVHTQMPTNTYLNRKGELISAINKPSIVKNFEWLYDGSYQKFKLSEKLQEVNRQFEGNKKIFSTYSNWSKSPEGGTIGATVESSLEQFRENSSIIKEHVTNPKKIITDNKEEYNEWFNDVKASGLTSENIMTRYRKDNIKSTIISSLPFLSNDPGITKTEVSTPSSVINDHVDEFKMWISEVKSKQMIADELKSEGASIISYLPFITNESGINKKHVMPPSKLIDKYSQQAENTNKPSDRTTGFDRNSQNVTTPINPRVVGRELNTVESTTNDEKPNVSNPANPKVTDGRSSNRLDRITHNEKPNVTKPSKPKITDTKDLSNLEKKIIDESQNVTKPQKFIDNNYDKIYKQAPAKNNVTAPSKPSVLPNTMNDLFR